MLTRWLIVIGALAALAPFVIVTGASATAPQPAAEPCTSGPIGFRLSQVGQPSASVNPVRGPGGTRGTIAVRNFLPNEEVQAIFRSTGDPVVASGKVGADGRLVMDFTVPNAPDGEYWILVAQANRTCVHAAVRFTIGAVTPTPTATATPTRPPTLPPATATATTPPPPATPTPVPPTPRPPTAGGGGAGTGGLDANVVTLGFLTVSLACVFMALADHRRKARADVRNRR